MEHYKSNLRDIREAAGISQEQLASEVGLNKKTIIAMESDEGADPKVSTVKRIMAYLQVNFEDLYVQNQVQ
ncbi:DNA-binding protein [Pseudobutyrivibrio ruminis]|uniref:DNA-binding protein n=1 Tax=Pseudobutyrivibrio ruminis TaxID=46206 RepID=A0A2G3ECQ0_9FIRM|nr:helix-turn-helix transcriptional regulator [Pseudobutyrivibrio ruminis]PHU41076.1 DNA-binding protein [Pseudobutyrivibrio ruminis]